ncbi:MAG: hypothetical protein NC388_00605 [Clostridium sp.]|nr:hypothetical protein [Clostridium sp.]
MCEIILTVWLVFVALVYLYMIADELYFSRSVRNKCRRIKETFTEE